MLLQLVQDLRRADRDAVRVSRHDPAAGLERVASPELDRVERQRRANFVDQCLQCRHCLQRSIAAHRPCGHAARVECDRGDVDFRNVVDADRAIGADGRYAGREIGEATAIQDVVGGECDNLAAGPIDPDPRVHLECVPLDARLELLIAIVSEPDRAAGQEHRRQRDVERERRMVASAEAAADIGEISVDARRLEGGAGFAQKVRDRFRGLVWRLHPDHELEGFAAHVVPGDAALRLEKHRVDRLGLEFAIQHQNGRIVRCKFRADLLAMGCGFGVGAPGRNREPRPYRAFRCPRNVPD